MRSILGFMETMSFYYKLQMIVGLDVYHIQNNVM